MAGEVLIFDTHNIDFDFISTLQIQTYKDLYVPDLNVMYRKISSIIQEVLSCNFIASLLLFFLKKYRHVNASSFLASPILLYI